MALTDEQRGPRAAWLYHHRVARFGSGVSGQEKLAAELRARGAYRAPDTIKGWEASDERSPISPDVLPHLEAIFDDKAPAPKRAITSEDVVSALAAQTEAITALVEELRLARLQQVEATAVALKAIGVLGANQAPRGRQHGTEREVPDGTAQ